MPCSKYKGKQRRMCYATDGWTKKPDTRGRKKRSTATKKKK